MNLWTLLASGATPVDRSLSSPLCAHSGTPLLEPEQGVVPVLHTPYDYDKGIS